MEFIKFFFKDDEKVVGLCSFRKKNAKSYTFAPTFNTVNLVYGTNTKNNFLLS